MSLLPIGNLKPEILNGRNTISQEVWERFLKDGRRFPLARDLPALPCQRPVMLFSRDPILGPGIVFMTFGEMSGRCVTLLRVGARPGEPCRLYDLRDFKVTWYLKSCI